MRELSRFVHVFDLGRHVALWHSLRMKPVFLERETYERFLKGECDDDLERELAAKKILLSSKSEDESVIARLRACAPKPDVNLAYFILSEYCNLACKYCFVGSDACGQGISSNKNMTVEVAEKAIDVSQGNLSARTWTTPNVSQISFSLVANLCLSMTCSNM